MGLRVVSIVPYVGTLGYCVLAMWMNANFTPSQASAGQLSMMCGYDRPDI